MANSIDLVELLSRADYATMDYHQLVDLELTLSWAKEIINTELSTKRQERLKALNDRYSSRANAGRGTSSVAAKTSVTSSPRGKALKEEPISQEQRETTAISKERSYIDRVIELAKETPLAKGIVPSAPYYMCYQFKISGDGELIPFGAPESCGWNTSAEVLKKLKVSEKAHMESDFKNVRTTPRGDYMVYRMEGGLFRVSYFKKDGEELAYDLTKVPDLDTQGSELLAMLDEILVENEDLAQVIIPSSRDIANQEKRVMSNASLKKEGKGPRGTIIIGEKDGEKRRWASFRACEKDLGVSPGTASQVVSGKMKSAKGWKLMKEED